LIVFLDSALPKDQPTGDISCKKLQSISPTSTHLSLLLDQSLPLHDDGYGRVDQLAGEYDGVDDILY
jgi:hypothetical protein